MQGTTQTETDRTARFERIAACDEETLVTSAESVLDGSTAVRVLQEPTTKLVMQRTMDPVEGRAFNLGEVLVTTAEVGLDDERGFAMVPGKAERKALAGAIVDVAVAADHPRIDDLRSNLVAAANEREERRRRRWAESRATTVSFDVMEDPP